MSHSPQPASRQTPPWRNAAPTPPPAPSPSPQPYAPQLHPDLAHLLAEYDNIVSSFEQGYIDEPNALALLAALVVVDASGAHWSLDEHRTFTRRPSPDLPAHPADPSHFAAHHAPAPVHHGYEPQAIPAPQRLPRQRRQRSAPPFLARILELVAANKVTVFVLVAALALVFAAFAVRGGSTTEPGDPAPSTSTPAPQPQSQAPTSDRTAEVLAAISSSDPALLASVFAAVPTGPSGTLEHARFVGLVSLGYRFVAGEAAGDATTATQPLIVQSSDGTAVASATMSWVSQAGVWVLASWPALAPS